MVEGKHEMKRRIKNVLTNHTLGRVCFFGAVGILSDVDHLIQNIGGRFGIDIPDKALHAPLVIIAIGGLCYFTAPLPRLLLGNRRQ